MSRLAPAAALALALGIGGATGLFAVIDALLLTPPPFADPARLAVVWENASKRHSGLVETSYPNYLAWRDENRAFGDLAAVATSTTSMGLTGAGEPLAVVAAAVTGNFFTTLGVRPLVGRGFVAADEDRAAAPAVVLGERLWRERFAAAPDIVGREVHLDGLAYRVVGVVPAAFDYPAGASIWVPLAPALGEAAGRRNLRLIKAVGRLRPGVAMSGAAAEMVTVAARLEHRYMLANEGFSASVLPLSAELLDGEVRRRLLAAWAVALLLATAALADAALFVGGRAAALRRGGLGDGLPLALAGGAGGVLFAWWGVAARVLVPASVPPASHLALGPAALAFAAALTAVAAVVLGIVARRAGTPPVASGAAQVLGTAPTPSADAQVPARTGPVASGTAQAASGTAQATYGTAQAASGTAQAAYGTTQAAAYGDAGRAAAAAHRVRRARLLLGLQAVLALVFLAAAGSALLEVARLARIAPGFNVRGVLTARVQLPASRYARPEERQRFSERLLASAAALPGVTAAATAVTRPLDLSATWDIPIAREGQGHEEQEQSPLVNFEAVSPGYFHALGIALLAGRDFTAADSAAAPPVAILGRLLAAQLWPGRDPIGRSVRRVVGNQQLPWIKVVGLAADAHYRGWDQTTLDLYVPAAQNPIADYISSADLLLATAGDPLALARPLRRAVLALDPQLPVASIVPLTELAQNAVAAPHAALRLRTALAVTALYLVLFAACCLRYLRGASHA